MILHWKPTNVGFSNGTFSCGPGGQFEVRDDNVARAMMDAHEGLLVEGEAKSTAPTHQPQHVDPQHVDPQHVDPQHQAPLSPARTVSPKPEPSRVEPSKPPAKP